MKEKTASVTDKGFVHAAERLETLKAIPHEKRTVLQSAEISTIAHTLRFGVDLGSLLRIRRVPKTSDTPLSGVIRDGREREIGF